MLDFSSQRRAAEAHAKTSVSELCTHHTVLSAQFAYGRLGLKPAPAHCERVQVGTAAAPAGCDGIGTQKLPYVVPMVAAYSIIIILNPRSSGACRVRPNDVQSGHQSAIDASGQDDCP